MHIKHNVTVDAMTEEKTKVVRGLDNVERILRDMESDVRKGDDSQAQALRVAGALVRSALANIDPDSSRRTPGELYHIGLFEAIGAKY
jgi:hypothetical protein